MEQDISSRQIAIYIHIPFCLTPCGYCTFFRIPYSKSSLEIYLQYLHKEIDLFLQYHPDLTYAKSIYFGGGTPSLLKAEEIEDICSYFIFDKETEITLEINPLQITENYLSALKNTPINRLSIGVQSMNNEELNLLDRKHKAEQIKDKIELCRQLGFNNISLDLIYGLPGSSINKLKDNLIQFLNLRPEHISCYLLTLDSDTPLADKIKERIVSPLPDDNLLAEEYELICSELKKTGYEHYEISNFCLPGRQSKHNLSYWKSIPYLGLGASASGFLPPYRYTNPFNLNDYYSNLDKGLIMPEAEHCSSKQLIADFIMMGLRLTQGIDLNELKERFNYNLEKDKHLQLDNLYQLGMIEKNGSYLSLSSKALFVSNTVIGELI
ncbi:MAG: radical SAM family heme chaperone HemW [Candidatus Syntrophosphaera sp.]|nr:radical SAM family heme chaperone HemW [Candidatus Syntrophosphaera sp.]